MAAALATETAALYDLRRTRKRRRLGDIEWFDSAYRVYLAALFGGGGVLWLSSAIGSVQLSAATARSVADHGPAWLGVVAAVAVMIGARSGAQGGPLALEAADVSMVMLAPVERGVALRRPAVQRLRSALGLGVLAGAVAGQLAGRRLPGSAPAWAAGGALLGLTVGLAWFGAALVAHGIRAKLAVTTAVGLALLGWQVAAAADDVPGPYTVVGSLGLWGWRQHPVDLVAVVVAVGLAVAGLASVGRTSLEALARRSSLVAQLRFAVTMQDLRTVVLLRRQLNQEHSRTRPWVRLRYSGRGDPVIRRGLRGLARTPLTRFVRIAAIAAVLGAAVAGAGRGATALVVVAALAGFLLGLETMEPLSQEIDQPNYTDSFPVARASLLVRHLVAPVVLLVPAAAVAAAAALAVLRRADMVAPVAILALPVALAGACGGVVSIVRDAPDPLSSQSQQAFLPPEMAGFQTTMRLLFPVVVSVIGVSAPLFVRSAVIHGESPVTAALRGCAGCVLVIGGTVTWVRYRDRVRARFRQFLDEGKNYNPNRPLPGGSS